MSETAHTSAPWSFAASVPSEGFECYWITACPAPNQQRELATVSGPQNAKNEANARLIAAAPDMLAALKHATALADKNLEHHSGRTGECAKSYQMCIDAIAKATGVPNA